MSTYWILDMIHCVGMGALMGGIWMNCWLDRRDGQERAPASILVWIASIAWIAGMMRAGFKP